MRRGLFVFGGTSLFVGLLVCSAPLHAQVKILFDATKGEMAGCADWVIDADQTNLGVGTSGTYITSSGNKSNPQQIPTPAQSGITSTTPETYWKGGLSSWAIDCAKKGYTVETLPWNGQITYNNTSNAQDLTHYKVFVIDEPNIKFTSAEKTALMQFVQNGGGLFMVADHIGSDRNGDTWDSPEIWNDFISTNSVQPYPFGIYFDTVDFSQTTTNVVATSTDSIIHGPMGNVTKAQFAGGTTMTLNPSVNASVKGVIFKTGTTAGNTNVMVAYARYGTGKVAALGDSSPTDDGTGNSTGTCSLYDGYWTDASGNHRPLLMNITIWLAGTTPSNVSVDEQNKVLESFNVSPNPAFGKVNITSAITTDNCTLTVLGIAGNIVQQKTIRNMNKDEQISVNLEAGFYILKMESEQGVQTSRVVVY